MRPALLFDEDYEDVRKYAAEQGISNDQALRSGMKQFADSGAEIYSKA